MSNVFGGKAPDRRLVDWSMSPDELSLDQVFDTDEIPRDRELEMLDARELPPPEPLRQTLERLADLEDDVVLLQRNDRAPQHLFPKLEDRGYRHRTVDDGDTVLTAIWRP